MSDQMILFNGYPFLDFITFTTVIDVRKKAQFAQDPHTGLEVCVIIIFLVLLFQEGISIEQNHLSMTVVNVMKRDLIVVYADGMPVPQLEEILQSTDYRGFPVVKSQTDRYGETLSGAGSGAR
jgi:DNA transposition AAA+ family ATPase